MYAEAHHQTGVLQFLKLQGLLKQHEDLLKGSTHFAFMLLYKITNAFVVSSVIYSQVLIIH